MKGLPARVAAYLLGVLAVIWPWGGFSYLLYVPGAGLDLIDLIVLALAVLTGLDLAFNRKLRLPFELTWPCLLLLALTIPSAVRRDTWTAGLAPVSVILFVSTVHFGPTRRVAKRWVLFSGVSGGCLAVYMLLSRFTAVLPVSYLPSTGLPAPFSHDPEWVAVTLVLCLVVLLRLAARRHAPRAVRVAALAGALAVLVVLLSSGDAPAFQWQARLAGRSVAAWAIAATAWWLVARVAAKLEVDRREQGNDLHLLLLAMMLLGACAHLLLPLTTRLPLAFLLGLAARHAVRRFQPSALPPTLPKAGVAVATVFIVVNCLWVLPGNIEHPYDYEELAARDYKAGHFGRIEERMAVFQGISPVETRTFLWRARAELAKGHPLRAAAWFAEIMEAAPPRPPLLPPPDDNELGAFLVRLRDFCSAHAPPERCPAYPRALAAAGKTDRAVAALRIRAAAKRPGREVDPAYVPSLAKAVAFLLGSGELAPALEGWSANDLLALLEHWGGGTGSQGPADIPEGRLPIVAVARVDATTISFLIEAAGEKLALDGIPVEAVDEDGSWAGAGWSRKEGDGPGVWNLEFVVPGDEGGEPLLRVRIAEGRPEAVTRGRGKARGAIPAETSLFILF